jgi:dipeptidyl aminopeptidase/acylaminoacyl peptidase
MHNVRVTAAVAGLAIALIPAFASAQTIDDLLNLKRVGAPAIAPDGQSVAYTLRETNWDENEYETEIWIARLTSQGASETRRLTNARKSSLQPEWSPDGQWLAFISDRDGKRQLYRIRVAGGEAEKLTNAEDGINNFAWSPDGRSIAFTMTDPVSESVKEREKRYGDIRIEDEDRRMAHLYVMAVPDATSGPLPSRRALTKGNIVVGSFDWSPDGTRIAFDHRISSDPADGGSADISVVDVATGTARVVVGHT